MKFNMRKMKDSGVKWIGKIPENWEICRIKDHFVLHTGFTPDTSKAFYYDDDGYNWANIADFNSKETIYNTKKKISDLYIQTFHPAIIPKGSLMYSFKLSVGQTAFTGSDMYSNEAIASFWPQENSNLHFLKYASSLIAENARTNIYNADILNKELIENAWIVYPTLKEQLVIANILDLKCAEINSLAANTQKQIELLQKYKKSVIMETVTKGMDPNAEMKDSRVEWLEKIPKEWKMVKYKRLADSRMGATILDKDLEEEGIPVYSATQDGKLFGYLKHPKFTISKGSIVIPARGSIGYANIITDEAATCTQTTICSTNFKHINSKFLYYCCNGLREKWFEYDGSVVPQITVTQVNNNYVPVPPIQEQNEIVSFLDRFCYLTNTLIEEKQSQIEFLTNYKKSLIYEYVTGKRVATSV